MALRGQSKILAKITKSGAKTSGAGERPKATHRIVALFNTAMVLLDAVVQVLIGTVQRIGP